MQNPGAGKTALGLDNNVGALLCYLGNLVCALGLIYSIIIVVTDKTNKLPRFHAFQSILLTVVGVILAVVINIISAVAIAADLGIVAMLFGLLVFVVYIGLFIAIVFTAIKAFQGNIFKLPVIGEMADKWSN